MFLAPAWGCGEMGKTKMRSMLKKRTSHGREEEGEPQALLGVNSLVIYCYKKGNGVMMYQIKLPFSEK